jgi:hypothetical protein
MSTVKKLEWIDYQDGDYLSCRAQSVAGSYEVWRLDYKSPFILEGVGKNGRESTAFETIDEAKAAAQSHYARIIFSALEIHALEVKGTS